jgi:ABC-2 type transport system ATP-binding protein
MWLAARFASGVQVPSGRVLLALVPLAVLLAGFIVFCLIDLARARAVRYLPKAAWALVIVLVSWPLGALAYLIFGKDRSHRPDRAVEAGAPATAGEWPVRPAVTGPGTARPAAASQIRHRRDRSPEDEPAARGPVVRTAGLTRDYGGTGLFDVDLRVPRGSVYGLAGPNGAGKTTLLSILAGLRRPGSGTVTRAVSRRDIAVCPDVPDFDRWLTAFEVVDLARSLVAPQAAGGDVLGALRAAGLADSADRQVSGFSRGMLQRLGLACAMVGDPQVLILDEPTAALDPAGRADILALIAGMRGHRTVIFSSHILADVQRVADHVGILREGRLLYQGSTQELIDRYLRPRWLVRVAGDIAPVAAALRAEPWATRVDPTGTGAIRVDAMTLEQGERGIPAVIAGCGARQVSCEPVAADLESAFLSLTGEIPPGGEAPPADLASFTSGVRP